MFGTDRPFGTPVEVVEGNGVNSAVVFRASVAHISNPSPRIEIHTAFKSISRFASFLKLVYRVPIRAQLVKRGPWQDLIILLRCGVVPVLWKGTCSVDCFAIDLQTETERSSRHTRAQENFPSA